MSDPDPSSRQGAGGDIGTPRWVKVFGIITLIVVLLLVVLLFTGGHGPGRHALPGGGYASPTAVIEPGDSSGRDPSGWRLR